MRLIDADAMLAEDLTDAFVDVYDNEIFEAIVERAPTIDAVPVVRCGDCKYWKEQYGGGGLCLLLCEDCIQFGGTPFYEEDYCSSGERKENTDA